MKYNVKIIRNAECGIKYKQQHTLIISVLILNCAFCILNSLLSLTMDEYCRIINNRVVSVKG